VNRYVDSTWGYVWVKVENHPAFGTRWVREHHLVWWDHTGERVPEGYVVHHLDEDRENNELTNLELLTEGEHQRRHRIGSTVSEETKHKMSVAAKALVDADERKARSERAKRQHREGKFGRQTWRKK
jgi:HNH endonuclease